MSADHKFNETLDVVRSFMKCESQAIELSAQRLDESVLDAIELLFALKGRVIFTGVGKMGCIARKAAATFCSTGTPAIFLHAAEASHGDLGIVCPDDVVVALSYSGQSDELLKLMPYMQRFKVPVVCLTGQPKSELARLSGSVIDLNVESEADFNELAPTSSTTVALAICDAIALTLAKMRRFTRQQFAMFHPGGNLGRKLLTTTKSLMHTGDDIPLASEKIVLRDAIVIMTEKRLGALLVTNEQRQLKGIITDGDIRRILQTKENPLQDPVVMLMNQCPFRTQKESLAAESLQIMHEHSISVLPVVDGEVVCGIIHLHDLLKAGLA